MVQKLSSFPGVLDQRVIMGWCQEVVRPSEWEGSREERQRYVYG